MSREKMPTTAATLWKKLPPGAHVALFYTDEMERRSVVREFVETGLAARECVGYIGDKDTTDEVLRSLEEMGVKRPRDAQALRVLAAAPTYCPEGAFVPETVIERFSRMLDDVKAGGYRTLRASGEMTWALRGLPGVENLVKYECAVDGILKEKGVTALCQYDVSRFSGVSLAGVTIFSLMQAHPWVIIGGRLFENPFYARAKHGFL